MKMIINGATFEDSIDVDKAFDETCEEIANMR